MEEKSKTVELREPVHPDVAAEIERRMSWLQAMKDEADFLSEIEEWCDENKINDVQASIFQWQRSLLGRLIERWESNETFYLDKKAKKIMKREKPRPTNPK